MSYSDSISDASRQPETDGGLPSPESLLDHALAYAAMGWHVFPLHSVREFGACSCTRPCKGPGKHPRTKYGVNDATTDPERIRAWWSQWPDANIGIACGSKSGLIVLDVDPRNGGDRSLDDAVMRHGALPETVTVATGGGGTHYYFKKAGHSATFHDSAGIDVQGDGSYIIAPPSRTASPYEFTDCSSPFEDGVFPSEPPRWVEDLATRETPPEVANRGGPQRPLQPMMPYDMKCVREALTVLAQTDAPVSRDSWIRVGMALHSTETHEAFGLWDAWSQSCPDKYDRAECVKQWRSFDAARVNGITLGSLFDMARGFGWDFPIETVQISDKPRVEQPDYPQELLRIPGILQQFVDYANGISMRAQPKLSIAAAVTLGATVMARRYAWRGSRSSIYQLCIAETGLGKDAGRKAIKNVMRASARYSDALLGEEFKSGAAVMSTVAMQPAGVALIDEYGHYLGGINNRNAGNHAREIAPKMMKMYSSTDTVMAGDEYGDKRMNQRKDIEYPCLNVFGTSTRKTLASGLTAEQIEDGFLNRHLIIMGDEDPPWVDLDDPPGLPNAVIEWMDRVAQYTPDPLQGLPSNPVKIGEEDGVRPLLLEFRAYADRQAKLANEQRDGVGGVWRRAYENVTRLCVALAGSECSFEGGAHPRVSVAACRWAIAYVSESTRKIVELALGEISDSAHEKAVNNAVRLIRKAGPKGMTGRELSLQVHQLKVDPRIRTAVLGDLQLHGIVGPVRIAHDGARGRPREAYVDERWVVAGEADEAA